MQPDHHNHSHDHDHTVQHIRGQHFTQGRYPSANGVWMNHGLLNPDIATLPKFLRHAGYHALLGGKTHLQPGSSYPFTYVDTYHDLRANNPADPLAKDSFVAADGRTIPMLSPVLADIRRQEREVPGPGNPWFLLCASPDPHGPQDMDPWTRRVQAGYQGSFTALGAAARLENRTLIEANHGWQPVFPGMKLPKKSPTNDHTLSEYTG